jgi:hypothetical protein
MLVSFDTHLAIETAALTLLMLIPGGAFWIAADLHAPARGWTVLRPCGLRLATAAGALAVCAVLAARGGLLIIGSGTRGGAADLWRGAAALVLALAFLYTAAVLLFLRFAFNEGGVRKAWFNQVKFVPWTEIARLDLDLICGLRLVLKSGERISLASRMVGLHALLTEAARHGVAVAPALGDNKAPKTSQRRVLGRPAPEI